MISIYKTLCIFISVGHELRDMGQGRRDHYLREDNTLSSFLDSNTEELRPSLKFQDPQRGIKPRVYHLWV